MQAKLEAKNKLGMDANYIKKPNAIKKRTAGSGPSKLQSCSYKDIVNCLDGSFKIGVLYAKDDI